MKKRIYKAPAQENAVMFNGKKYNVAARGINSIRLTRPDEDIIVHPSQVQEIKAQEQDQPEDDA